ncbi:MAG: hypothetical protein QXP81_09525 [Nitrososphaerota archaeon]
MSFAHHRIDQRSEPDSTSKLRELLERGKDWERARYRAVPGVFVVRAPASGSKPAQLMVEINPVGPDGQPTKRSGLFLRNVQELEVYREILNNPALAKLLEDVERVNPRRQGGIREI